MTFVNEMFGALAENALVCEDTDPVWVLWGVGGHR
jgi:hypothetical protein